MPSYQVVARFRRARGMDAAEVRAAVGALRAVGAELEAAEAPGPDGALDDGPVDVRIRAGVTATWPTAAVARVVDLLEHVRADLDVDLGEYQGVEVRQA